MWLSIIDDNKLLADVIACISPVKCRFISSIGAIWTFPPPVAPPFIPKTGPKDGSLSANIAFLFILFSPSAIAIDTVVFPSPNGVGFIAVTSISFPFLFDFNLVIACSFIFALYFPYSSISSSCNPQILLILLMFCSFVALAISISVILSPFFFFIWLIVA